MNRIFSTYAVLFIIALLFNFLWEISHVRLYVQLGPGEMNTAHLLWFSVKDAGLFLLFTFAVAVYTRSWMWFVKPSGRVSLALLFVIGFVVAALIERHALATGRWAYLAAMPVIPLVGAGLTPILQMSLGPVIAAVLTKKAVG